jgi:hypothetical protein
MPRPAVSPDAAPDAPVVQEDQPEAAPEAATTQIITEAVETTDKPALAPTSSARPRSKPPARTAETPAAEAPAAAATAEAEAPPAPEEDSIAEAVAAALSEAEAEPAGNSGTVENAGPPMTDGEKDALRVAVQACWNVGTLSSDAMLATVTVGMTMTQAGVPQNVRLIASDGQSEEATRVAFDFARRAILRCSNELGGYKLPPEKYEQWRTIEMTFDPEKMRQK